jgi:hypothetical protein
LAGYFDANLVSLILANQACERRTGEACAIDFVLVFGLQDNQVTDLAVHAADKDGKHVPVRYGYGGQPRSLDFVMAKTVAGWRITDIRYPEGSSLVGLLK